MIDVLVVNHNTKSKLKRFLDTISAGDTGYLHISVADNGSVDGSVEFLEQNANKYPLEHIDYNKNIGYAAAINKLAARGSSPFIGIFNADVWLTTEDVLAVISNMALKDIGISGPKQRDENGKITHAGIFGSLVAPKHRGWKQPDPSDSLYRDISPCVTVSGSAYFIKRDIWDLLAACPTYVNFHEKVLGLPVAGAMPMFPHFFEETLVSYHAHAHGISPTYDGTVSIGHSWHSSSPIGSDYVNTGFKIGKKYFQKFCDMHGIEHD